MGQKLGSQGGLEEGSQILRNSPERDSFVLGSGVGCHFSKEALMNSGD